MTVGFLGFHEFPPLALPPESKFDDNATYKINKYNMYVLEIVGVTLTNNTCIFHNFRAYGRKERHKQYLGIKLSENHIGWI
ncbi:hypothetical protein LXL04_031645 [Taraxacum kok-saghyz]